MTGPADLPAKPLHTWRPMALWSAGILLALGLAWFVGAVAVPVWQVRSGLVNVGWFVSGPVDRIPGGDALVIKLGGPVPATSKLELYLCMPREFASKRAEAVEVLAEIEPPAKDAIPVLKRLVNDDDEAVRNIAASALNKIQGQETAK